MFVKYEVLALFERCPGFDEKRCVKKIPVAVYSGSSNETNALSSITCSSFQGLLETGIWSLLLFCPLLNMPRIMFLDVPRWAGPGTNTFSRGPGEKLLSMKISVQFRFQCIRYWIYYINAQCL